MATYPLKNHLCIWPSQLKMQDGNNDIINSQHSGGSRISGKGAGIASVRRPRGCGVW